MTKRQGYIATGTNKKTNIHVQTNYYHISHHRGIRIKTAECSCQRMVYSQTTKEKKSKESASLASQSRNRMGLTNNSFSKIVPGLVAASTPTLKVISTPILAFTWTPAVLAVLPQTPPLFARALRSAFTSGNFNFRAASKAGRPMTSNVRATVGCAKAVMEAFATALSWKGICWMVGDQLVNWVLLGLIRSALSTASLEIYGTCVRKSQ